VTRLFDSFLDRLQEKPPEPVEADPPLTFAEFVRIYNTGSPNLLEYEHIPPIVAACQKLVDTYADPDTGELRANYREWKPGPDGVNWRALMVLLPRRYFKSEVFSRLLPAYFLYRFPILWMGLTSYASNQSLDFSRAARDNFTSAGR
jgi:hypothetical protein